MKLLIKILAGLCIGISLCVVTAPTAYAETNPEATYDVSVPQELIYNVDELLFENGDGTLNTGHRGHCDYFPIRNNSPLPLVLTSVVFDTSTADIEGISIQVDSNKTHANSTDTSPTLTLTNLSWSESETGSNPSNIPIFSTYRELDENLKTTIDVDSTKYFSLNLIPTGFTSNDITKAYFLNRSESPDSFDKHIGRLEISFTLDGDPVKAAEYKAAFDDATIKGELSNSVIWWIEETGNTVSRPVYNTSGNISSTKSLSEQILHIAPKNGRDGSFAPTWISEQQVPWYTQRGKITSAQLYEGLSASGSLYGMFSTQIYNTEIDLSDLDTSEVTNLGRMFFDCRDLQTVNIDTVTTDKVKDLSFMFYRNYCFTSLDLSSWNTSQVTKMNYMFSGCKNISDLQGYEGWDTSKVKDMSALFNGCESITSLDLSSWNTSQVTDMSYIFTSCKALTSLNTTGWDTSQVSTFTSAFGGCLGFSSLDLSHWDVSNAVFTSEMFKDCKALTSLNTTGWDTSKLQKTYYMFYDCTNLTSIQDISTWNTSQVFDMGSMFGNCKALTSLDLSSWNMQNVTGITYMFMGCSKLTTVGDISNWRFPKLKNIHGMFSGCSKLSDIQYVSHWDTSMITNTSHIFNGCESITSLDLSHWNMSKVKDITTMFNGCTSLTSLNTTGWDTSQVQKMDRTFEGCRNLVLDCSAWDVSNVTSHYLFNGGYTNIIEPVWVS